MYQYQRATSNSFPDELPATQLHEFHQKFLEEFLVCSSDVSNHPKYINAWLDFADSSKHYDYILAYMYERKIGQKYTGFWLKLSEMFERRNLLILADESILSLLKKKQTELEIRNDPENRSLSLNAANNLNASFQANNSFILDDSMTNQDSELKYNQTNETLKKEIDFISDYYSKFEERIYKELSDPLNEYWFCGQPRNYERIEMSEATFNLVCDLNIEKEIQNFLTKLYNPYDCSLEDARISSQKKKTYVKTNINSRNLDELVGQIRIGKCSSYIDYENRELFLTDCTRYSRELQYWITTKGANKNKGDGLCATRMAGKVNVRHFEFWIYQENFQKKRNDILKRHKKGSIITKCLSTKYQNLRNTISNGMGDQKWNDIIRVNARSEIGMQDQGQLESNNSDFERIIEKPNNPSFAKAEINFEGMTPTKHSYFSSIEDSRLSNSKLNNDFKIINTPTKNNLNTNNKGYTNSAGPCDSKHVSLNKALFKISASCSKSNKANQIFKVIKNPTPCIKKLNFSSEKHEIKLNKNFGDFEQFDEDIEIIKKKVPNQNTQNLDNESGKYCTNLFQQHPEFSQDLMIEELTSNDYQVDNSKRFSVSTNETDHIFSLDSNPISFGSNDINSNTGNFNLFSLNSNPTPNFGHSEQTSNTENLNPFTVEQKPASFGSSDHKSNNSFFEGIMGIKLREPGEFDELKENESYSSQSNNESFILNYSNMNQNCNPNPNQNLTRVQYPMNFNKKQMIENNKRYSVQAKDMPREQYIHNENRRESNQFGSFFKKSQYEGMEYCDYVMKVQESKNLANQRSFKENNVREIDMQYSKKRVKLCDAGNQNNTKGRLSLKSNFVTVQQSKIKEDLVNE